jgi:hypothetical protein
VCTCVANGASFQPVSVKEGSHGEMKEKVEEDREQFDGEHEDRG